MSGFVGFFSVIKVLMTNKIDAIIQLSARWRVGCFRESCISEVVVILDL